MYDDKQAQDMRKANQAQDLLATLLERGSTEGWLIDKSEITCGPVLGKGAFGTTYAGTWRGANVAIKVVRVSDTSELINFLREVQSMCVLKHPNIVAFLGAVLCSPTDFWLLTEFMPGGTLAAWLHPTSSTRARQAAISAAASRLAPQHSCQGNAQSSTTSSSSSSSSSSTINKKPTSSILHLPPYIERLTMALEVAQGLMALESCNPPIIHRDIKPSNVLIDAAGHARLADFGLSRQYLSARRAEFTGETGTYLYMAPEMMRHEVYDCKVDMWSWGVLFVEAITCQMPYVERLLTPEQVALGVADHKFGPCIPTNIDKALQMIAAMACKFEPEARADFEFISNSLQSTINHIKAEGILEPMGLLSRLHHSLTSPWGEILSRMYPVPAQPPSLVIMLPREKLYSHSSYTNVGGGVHPLDTSHHDSPPTSHSSSRSGSSSLLPEGSQGPLQHAVDSGELARDAQHSSSSGGGDYAGRSGTCSGEGVGGVSAGSVDERFEDSARFNKLSIDDQKRHDPPYTADAIIVAGHSLG